MADIVLGLATSHGPLLGLPPEDWYIRADVDRANKEHFFRNRVWDFDALAKERDDGTFAAQAELPVRRERFEACQRALEQLAEVYAAAKADVVVVIGDDQLEFFRDAIPPFSIYWGDTIANAPTGGGRPLYSPAEGATYPGAPELGLHLIKALQADRFDVTSVKEMPPRQDGRRIIPHAYGFIYHRIMKNRVAPNVPILLNTFYPPNQPTVQRCIDFGSALRRAIAAWDSDLRVALIASGGLTHFVVDEDVDRFMLDALADNDLERLNQLDEMTFQSGTSETKNWLPVAAAMRDEGRSMTLVDYVPCYRTEAGTGSGMGFAYWA